MIYFRQFQKYLMFFSQLVQIIWDQMQPQHLKLRKLLMANKLL